MGGSEVYLSFARLGASRPPQSVQVETRLSQGGVRAVSVSTPGMKSTIEASNVSRCKIAQALTHSTLQYVSPVAFEQPIPLDGKESPTLESPFFRANSTYWWQMGWEDRGMGEQRADSLAGPWLSMCFTP